MSLRACPSPFVAAAALVLVSLSVPAHAVLVTVDLRTDYVPYDDFVAVDASIASVETGVFGRTARRTDLFDTDFPGGERIADFTDVPENRDYIITIALWDRERIVGRRQLAVGLGNSTRSVTVLFPRPEGRAKTFTLTDNDGDGQVSAGDVLRYTVDASGGSAFLDKPGPGGRLIAGTVTTTEGTIRKGNADGDDSVYVLQPGTVSFDVEVAPLIANQGRIYRQSGMMLTDDPATPEPNDPTVAPVTCAAAEYASQLRRCQARLDILLADPDGDGVIAALDLCPRSGKGASVDDRGCSQAQFCGRIDQSQRGGPALCRAADWLGDETLSAAPQDCRPSGAACEARLK